MNIFDFTDYKELLQAWLQEQPKKGRGIAQRLSEKLRISTVLISQILTGSRTLQLDYAYGIAEFMTLTPNETDYFLILVQYENAGHAPYKKHLKTKMDLARKGAQNLKTRVADDIQLNEEAKARFYSHWHYSAIRLLCDIPELQTPRSISEKLNISIDRVSEVLLFLVEQKLCIQEGGRFSLGVRSTHLESNSPWIYSRQLQWRQKAMQTMEENADTALFYTGPMVLSEKDRQWVRERTVLFVKEITERARNSPSEKLACLNIDWFPVVPD